jgi:hypothetical protein
MTIFIGRRRRWPFLERRVGPGLPWYLLQPAKRAPRSRVLRKDGE